MTTLLYILLATAFWASMSVFLAESAAHAVLFLIIFIFDLGILYMLLSCEFFGFFINLIYIGAVAILFIFAIMLIELHSEKKYFFRTMLQILAYLCLISIFSLPYMQICLKYFSFYDDSALFDINTINYETSVDIFSKIENSSQLLIFSQDLFNYHFFLVLLVGLILIVALVGSVFLAYNYNKMVTEKELALKQNIFQKESQEDLIHASRIKFEREECLKK